MPAFQIWNEAQRRRILRRDTGDKARDTGLTDTSLAIPVLAVAGRPPGTASLSLGRARRATVTDNRMDDDMPPLEHDEFHSSLEVDDTTGWRVFIVPVTLLILLFGMIAFFFLYQGNMEPDPRIAGRLKADKTQAVQAPPPVADGTNQTQ